MNVRTELSSQTAAREANKYTYEAEDALGTAPETQLCGVTWALLAVAMEIRALRCAMGKGGQ